MKRILSSVLSLVMAFTCCYGVVLAADVPNTRASLTLSDYNVELYAGDSRGAVYINYDVESSKLADSIGVESIAFYKSDGSYVTTITGSTRNGLICTDTILHAGDYDCALTSGVSYYAKVKVFARVGSEYDSRTITTGTIKAP